MALLIPLFTASHQRPLILFGLCITAGLASLYPAQPLAWLAYMLAIPAALWLLADTLIPSDRHLSGYSSHAVLAIASYFFLTSGFIGGLSALYYNTSFWLAWLGGSGAVGLTLWTTIVGKDKPLALGFAGAFILCFANIQAGVAWLITEFPSTWQDRDIEGWLFIKSFLLYSGFTLSWTCLLLPGRSSLLQRLLLPCVAAIAIVTLSLDITLLLFLSIITTTDLLWRHHWWGKKFTHLPQTQINHKTFTTLANAGQCHITSYTLPDSVYSIGIRITPSRQWHRPPTWHVYMTGMTPFSWEGMPNKNAFVEHLHSLPYWTKDEMVLSLPLTMTGHDRLHTLIWMKDNAVPLPENIV